MLTTYFLLTILFLEAVLVQTNTMIIKIRKFQISVNVL